jgi:hypothetical protein
VAEQKREAGEEQEVEVAGAHGSVGVYTSSSSCHALPVWCQRAGQMTRHVRIVDKDGGHTADVWLSDRYPASLWRDVFSGGDEKASGPSTGWSKLVQREYGVKPGFVMKALSKGKDGKKAGLEVTRMQTKKVPAGAFKVPPGYKVVETPTMPGGLSNMKAPTTQEEAEKMRDEWMQKMKEMQEQQR